MPILRVKQASHWHNKRFMPRHVNLACHWGNPEIGVRF